MDDSASASDLKSQATAISDGIAAMHREHYGRGADRTRTLIHQDVVMTRLEECFTTVEKKMIAEGAFVQVRETRRVGAFFSQVSHDPDMALEVFLLEGAGLSVGDGKPS